MKLFRWPRRDKLEKRSSASGFTAEIIAMREAYISGARGVGELTATAQTCIGLWESAFTLADVSGTNMLTRRTLALIARSLALRGEVLFLIRDTGLVPCSDWDLSTSNGAPRAYRCSVSEAHGGTTQTALAGEVLHVRIGSDVAAPYYGTSPLKRASLTAGMLHCIETALCEIYEMAPLGSQIVPFPESPETDMASLGRDFRGRRGRVLLRESVNVTAAGGPTPQTDWRPQDVTPNLEQAMIKETLDAAREAICGVFGVLPGLLNPSTTGPLVREAQRHLAQWQLQPMAALLSEEASLKLGGTVTVDVMRPLQAYDAGGRARALTGIIQALTQAKEAGVDANKALTLVDWE